VGSSAAGRNLYEDALTLAVAAAIRNRPRTMMNCWAAEWIAARPGPAWTAGCRTCWSHGGKAFGCLSAQRVRMAL